MLFKSSIIDSLSVLLPNFQHLNRYNHLIGNSILLCYCYYEFDIE